MENTGRIKTVRDFIRKEYALDTLRVIAVSARIRVLLATIKERIGQVSAFSVKEISVDTHIRGVTKKHGKMLRINRKEVNLIEVSNFMNLRNNTNR